jgi:hypothetical protein
MFIFKKIRLVLEKIINTRYNCPIKVASSVIARLEAITKDTIDNGK